MIWLKWRHQTYSLITGWKKVRNSYAFVFLISCATGFNLYYLHSSIWLIADYYTTYLTTNWTGRLYLHVKIFSKLLLIKSFNYFIYENELKHTNAFTILIKHIKTRLHKLNKTKNYLIGSLSQQNETCLIVLFNMK